MFFDGRYRIKSTWYHCRLYKMVNLYHRPCTCQESEAAVEWCFTNSHIYGSWWNIIQQPLHSLGRCKAYDLYTCRLPLIILMPHIPIPARCGPSPIEGQYHYKLAWYQCRSYKQVNMYKYRRPLIIPMPNAMCTHTYSPWNRSIREAVLYQVDPISVHII